MRPAATTAVTRHIAPESPGYMADDAGGSPDMRNVTAGGRRP
jgi:hypothetical protein